MMECRLKCDSSRIVAPNQADRIATPQAKTNLDQEYLCYIRFMQAVLDIPDNKFSLLSAKAQHEGVSVDEIVLRGIDKVLESEPEIPKPLRIKHPVIPSTRQDKLVISNEQIDDLSDPPPTDQNRHLRFPVIRSKNPGSLKLGEEGVYEYIPFP